MLLCNFKNEIKTENSAICYSRSFHKQGSGNLHLLTVTAIMVVDSIAQLTFLVNVTLEIFTGATALECVA